MCRHGIKILISNNTEDLEKQVNDFLKEHDEIYQIQYTSISQSVQILYSCMIHYNPYT